MAELLSIRPNLEVSDLQPTVDHLLRVFGFDEEVREEQMGLALLRRDAVAVAVVRTDRPSANETTAAYIGVQGVDALHDTAVGLGARVVVPLTDHPWGLRDFVAQIPGGHRLAFGERIG